MTHLPEVSPVTHNIFLQPTPWCTIRPQKEGYVFYNARTDELHLITESGYAFYQRCDGLHLVGDIVQEYRRDTAKQGHFADRDLLVFFEHLLARGILEISHDARS